MMTSCSHTADRYRPSVFTFLAGLAYSFYLLTWVGALGMGFVFASVFCLLLVIAHFRRQSMVPLVDMCVFFFAPAGIVSWLFSLGTVYTVTLSVAVFFPLLLFYLSRWMHSKSVDPIFYPVAILISVFVIYFLASIVSPSVVSSLLPNFQQLAPSRFMMVSEMQPLFSPSGSGFTWSLAWANYSWALPLGIVGLLYLVVKLPLSRLRSPALLLFTVWCLVLLLANVAQRRYGYYFTVSAALLSGCAIWLLSRWLSRCLSWLCRVLLRPYLRDTGSHRKVSLILMVVFCAILLFPSLSPALRLVSGNAFSVPVGWRESLTWLRANSPEPLGSDSVYYSLYRKSPTGIPYLFPSTAYSVAAWTDYGYWITRIAHRLPVDNPGHLPLPSVDLFHLLMSTDDAQIRFLEDKLRVGYIVLDYQTVFSKFVSILSYFGESSNKYFGKYTVNNPKTNTMESLWLFYPEYHRTLAARLFIFDGKSVAPPNTLVVSIKGSTISGAWRFDNYSDAVNFVAGEPSAMIVSDSPAIPAVPLEAVIGHDLVYSYQGNSITEAVKVFKVSSR